MRAFLADRWPLLLGAAATVGYAILVIGFGLDFRPLHHDEGVTLNVAERPSAIDVLRTAVDVRHGPPLHYLIVHASLAWRHDILGLRLPSAILGVVAVALAYGCGRELLGRAGGAAVAVVTAATPITIHLAQFARGYTAMIASAYASLWLLLILVRTGQVRWVAPYAVAALLLVASHPFGLFALASELVLLVGFGLRQAVAEWRGNRRALTAASAAMVLATAAFALLRHVYAPLEATYNVGHGPPVVELGSSSFWSDLAGHVSGYDQPPFWAVLGAAVVLGMAALAVRNRRALIVAAVWIALPLALLQGLTASSPDFAPERHLSFLMPGYALAVAGFALELGRLVGRRWWITAAVLGALLAPLLVADHNDLSNFNANLRDASLALASQFGPHDILMTTAGQVGPLEDARLLGAYAVLDAPSGSSLSEWHPVDAASRCGLIRRLGQRRYPERVWLIASTVQTDAVTAALRTMGASTQAFGPIVIASAPPPYTNTRSALYLAKSMWRRAAAADPNVRDFRRMARLYRSAARKDSTGVCRFQ